MRDVPLPEFLVSQHDLTGCDGAYAHDRLDELGLAVALHPGDAEDLAPVDVEGDVVDDGPAVGGRAR